METVGGMNGEHENQPSLGALAGASLRIGCLGFGGPAGQIALMHRVFVEEKKWIDEARYLHALNYCMLLPGPEAQQLATYVGWLLHGVRGGVIAGLLFVAPGALIVFALSWLYALYGHSPAVSALFFGVKIAVIAFIVDAVVRIGRRALKTWTDAAIAAAAFAALFLFGAPFPFVILAAAALGATRAPDAREHTHETGEPPRIGNSLATAGVWGAAWLAPVGLIVGAYGPEHVLSAVALLFSQLSVVTFGGAYAVLAYLQQQAVDVHAWLTPGQMVDGLGLAETTPGPLILVNQYVGFLAGWKAGGLPTAIAAAALASWCTFAPSFVWIFAGAPFAEQIRRNQRAVAALRAITAAVLGVIASLSLWFALHVLFREQAAIAGPFGHVLAFPVIDSIDPVALPMAIAASVALIRFKANAALLVLACAASGWALQTLGLS